MQRRQFLQTTLAATSLAFPETTVSGKQVDEKPFIINAGIGGNNTVDLLARIDKDCLSHKPDFTILMIGTNDMNSKKYIPLPEYEKNLRKIVEMILGVKSQIMLMTILPVYEPHLYTRHERSFYGDAGHKGRKEKVNETIKKAADDYKLHFLDMHRVFDKVGNISEERSSLLQNTLNSEKTDGVHPTPEGYRTMAVAVYEALIRTGVSYNRLVCFGDSITNGGGGVEGNSYPGYLKKLLGY
ncbi:GDSL-type esterase/lipase family protein [Dyadobacter sp. LHD-138]|uniref:SGNH/GDSL hydrolase family protein n=1 Tax=Dyadobacter sp. LHD-138 TaxID=3071413 RepID=UPI0027E17ADE|nr:GDSL-type esterase/lipase family protein [Dyadobacter sp. LHD-138]MDQ6482059.1 GDSL-type esterase/lipase family protein [Dyadobacter sp. LHD-138]